jgi:hypothetical protein
MIQDVNSCELDNDKWQMVLLEAMFDTNSAVTLETSAVLRF